jgi:uncharacterized protein (TIGR02145 family)
MKKFVLFLCLCSFMLLFACEKRPRDNPWDEKADPAAWAPKNVRIEIISDSSLMLEWDYNVKTHEGFKIERKVNAGQWIMLDSNLNPESRTYFDNHLDLINTVYHYRVFAFLMDRESNKINLTGSLKCEFLKLTDTRDGQKYETVQIGNQCWMKENLKWLPDVNTLENNSSNSPRYYVYGYYGTSVSSAKSHFTYKEYGVLYNWPAAHQACPDGWHLPSEHEWQILIDYLGGDYVAGGKMKSSELWYPPNTGATDESGFSGLPGGTIVSWTNQAGGPAFVNYGTRGYWWSSTISSSTTSFALQLKTDNPNAFIHNFSKKEGLSLRCIKN